MPCPGCSAKLRKTLFEESELPRMFERIEPGANALTCPKCGVRWVVERSVGSASVFLRRAAGLEPHFEGDWSFYETAPRAEGDSHEVRMSLRRQGERLAGTVEDSRWNDYAVEETKQTQRWEVTGRIEGECAVIDLPGDRIWIPRSGDTFAIKPVALHDYDEQPKVVLFVSGSLEDLLQNRPFRTWRPPRER